MTLSQDFFLQAQEIMPGGVNSPVRAYNGVGGTPRFIKSGEGPYIYDEDGNRLIDYVGSWGPAILGHANKQVIADIKKQLEDGLGFGAPSVLENQLGQMVIDLVPSVEKIRMVNSGTEAALSAIRLARGTTKRGRIIKFEGCYHGHADSLLVKAGSGALTLGVPSSPGVPSCLAELTTTLPYNDLTSCEKAFDSFGEEIAAVIVEPVAGNMSCIPPAEGFLHTLRVLTKRYGSVLIFDEVMTGFRVHLGGAQQLYGVQPDLTILGKILGGGMPVGAVGGSTELMDQFAPNGPIYQAGTLSGNPLAMASGLSTLKQLTKTNFHANLLRKTQYLCEGIDKIGKEVGVPLKTNHVCGMFGIFFSKNECIKNLSDVTACDLDLFKRFFHLMLDKGINLAPSAFEAGFISDAHSQEDLDYTIEKIKESVTCLRD